MTPARVLALVCLGALLPSSASAGPGWDRQVGGRARESQRDALRYGPGETVHDGPVSRSAVLASLRELEQRGAASGLKLTVLSPPRARYTIVKVDLPATGPRSTRVCISSGIHYEEAFQGVRQAQSFLGSVLGDRSFRSKFDLTMLFTLPVRSASRAASDPDQRRLVRGRDLNRTFSPARELPETRLLMGAVAGRRFDLFVDLHADSRLEGFVLVNESRGRGESSWRLMSRALSAMPSASLLDASRSRPVAHEDYRLGRLGAARTPSLAGCFDSFMATTVPYSFTLETPQRTSPEWQLRGGLRLLRSLLDNVRAHGRPRDR